MHTMTGRVTLASTDICICSDLDIVSAKSEGRASKLLATASAADAQNCCMQDEPDLMPGNRFYSVSVIGSTSKELCACHP